MYLGLWRFLGAALLGVMRFIERLAARARLLLAECGQSEDPALKSAVEQGRATAAIWRAFSVERKKAVLYMITDPPICKPLSRSLRTISVPLPHPPSPE